MGWTPRFPLPLFLAPLLFFPIPTSGVEARAAALDEESGLATEESSPEPSQTGRAAELERERERRAAAFQPSKPSKVAEVLATIENKGFERFVTVQVERFRFGIGSLGSGVGFAPGATYERPRLGQTELTFRASGSYAFSGSQVYGLQFGKFELAAPRAMLGSAFFGAPFEFDRRTQRPNQTFLYGDLQYFSAPRLHFYGLGPDSSEADRTNYLYEHASFDAVGGFQFTRWLALQGRAGYLMTNVGPGRDGKWPSTDEVFDDTQAPGLLTEQPDFVRYDAGIYLSWLDYPELPAGSLGVRYGRFDDIDTSRFQFNRFSVDARGFLPLGSRQRVLAARLFGSRDFADRNSQVPFYFMNTLGGDETLKGFKPMRFRDSNVLFATFEYRWEANAAIEFAVFYDMGKVFPDRSGFTFEHTKHTMGGGIRCKSMRRVVFRIDYGRSEDGNFVYFAFGPTF